MMTKTLKTQFLDPTVIQNLRKGAILGLTTLACMITNHNSETFSDIIKQVFNAVLLCFRDSDPKIVYSAESSMYDLMRYIPQQFILKYFTDIFEGLLIVRRLPFND